MRRASFQGRVNRILAVLFVAAIALMSVMTLLTKWDEIYDAVRRMDYLRAYLPEHWNGMDLFNARLRSLESKLGGALWKSEELGYVNSAFQYALGKKMINTGGSQMVKLNTGHLYDLQGPVSAVPKVSEIADLKDLLDPNLPFLFVYEHPVVYDEGMFPEGYEKLDYGTEFADEAVSLMRARGIDTIDSREVLNASGYSYDELLWKSDQHWTTLAAIVMAREIAREAAEKTGLPIDPNRIDPEGFETKVYEKLFLGKYGQRVGTGLIDPDDIVVYWPAYETEMRRETFYLGQMLNGEGSFREAIVRWDKLERGRSGYNINAYMDYGLTENYEHIENRTAPRARILLLKDSYSAPIGAFLSLTASDVYAVDMRRSNRTFPELVEEFEPDIVVVAYSQQMLRDENYQFVG